MRISIYIRAGMLCIVIVDDFDENQIRDGYGYITHNTNETWNTM